MAKFLIDTDPGHDDALAILYAARHLDLVGLTTVFGNQTLDKTTRNALCILELGDIDVPVAVGAHRPLVGTAATGADAHGKSGLDGAEFPEPRRKPVGTHAVDYIIEQSRFYPGQLTVVAIGPLTNVALALLKDEGLAGRLAGISLMGGSTDVGNMTATAELNIHADPEAAAVVFASGARLHMAGLNITRTVGATADDIQRLRDGGGKVAATMADLLHFYYTRLVEHFGRDVATLHDPCAVIPFVRPGLVRYADLHVDVELCGTLTRGMTVCDRRGIPLHSVMTQVAAPRAPNTAVAIAAEGRAIVDEVLETILAY